VSRRRRSARPASTPPAAAAPPAPTANRPRAVPARRAAPSAAACNDGAPPASARPSGRSVRQRPLADPRSEYAPLLPARYLPAPPSRTGASTRSAPPRCAPSSACRRRCRTARRHRSRQERITRRRCSAVTLGRSSPNGSSVLPRGAALRSWCRGTRRPPAHARIASKIGVARLSTSGHEQEGARRPAAEPVAPSAVGRRTRGCAPRPSRPGCRRSPRFLVHLRLAFWSLGGGNRRSARRQTSEMGNPSLGA
jgi:hypothetical protein